MTAGFYKMTGSGNDFVFLDGREARLEDWPADRIAAVCHRRNGVGADGLVLLAPEPDGAVRMHYFNADGGRAALCGNASLCATRLGTRLGMARPEGMTLRTDAGDLRTRCTGPGHLAELRFPSFPMPPAVTLEWEQGESGLAWLGDIGVPHLIVLVDDVSTVEVARRGRVLRYAPQFAPHGTNVNFVGVRRGADGPDWRIRTYERGIEGETMACGTGTICAAFALASRGLAELPVRMTTASGSVLAVAGHLAGGRCEEVWLCGEGRLVYTGALEGP